MSNAYTRIAILLAVVASISGGVIYFTFDIHAFIYLTAFHQRSLLLVALFMAIGFYFDSTRLMSLTRIADHKITLIQSLPVVFSNYFLALLTPGAMGGAVAQVVFLRRAGVPVATATVVVLIRTAMSIIFLFCCFPVVFYYDPGLIPWIPSSVLIGVSLVFIGLCGAGIWALRSTVSVKILVKIARKLNPARRRKAFSWYRDARGAVFVIMAAPMGMLRVFLESAASLISLYCIVPALFWGLGIDFDWPLVLGRMIFLNQLLYFAPTPGGSGIAEGTFVLLFNGMVPSGTVGVLAVVWRMFAEYVPFCIGLYYTVKIFGKEFLNKMGKESGHEL